MLNDSLVSVDVNLAGNYSFASDVGSVRVTTLGSIITIGGDIRGDLRQSSHGSNEITIGGDVHGAVKFSDTEQGIVKIKGDVSGFFDAWNISGINFSAGTIEGVRIRSALEVDYSLGESESFIAWDSEYLNIKLEKVHYVSWSNVDNSSFDTLLARRVIMSGDDNLLTAEKLGFFSGKGNENVFDIDMLSHRGVIRRGDQNKVLISESDDSSIILKRGAKSTDLTIETGDVRLVDKGKDTNAHLGDGDDIIISKARGEVSYNGGLGNDILSILGAAEVTVRGIEVLNIFNLNADVFVFELSVEGTLYSGELEFSLPEQMSKHGYARGNDAVLELSHLGHNGTITMIDAADEFLFAA